MEKKKLKTISIKGKEYVMVNQRILAFNEAYANGRITSDIILDEGGILRIQATVIPDLKNPERYFTGYSEVIRDISKPLETPQMLETVETSAIGRALAMMGIGIIEGIASADEVNKAINGNIGILIGNCSVCGTKGKAGKFGAYCPNYKREDHYDEGGKKNWKILTPKELMTNPTENENKFNNSL